MNFQVEICNWDKYNPRSDAKAWSWFRFQADFFGDEDLCDLPGAHLLVFIYICCKRSRSRAKIADFKLRHCAAAARTSEDDAEKAIHTLAARGLIRLREASRTDPNVDEPICPDPNGSVRGLSDPFPTYVRTDDTTSSLCPPPGANNDDGPGLSPTKLLTIWNENRGEMPKARMTSKRRPHAAARIAEEPDPNYWVGTVRRLAISPVATGKVKSDRYPNGWKADFEWLIKNDTNHVKVNEGKYDDRSQGGARRTPTPIVSSLEELDALSRG